MCATVIDEVVELAVCRVWTYMSFLAVLTYYKRRKHKDAPVECH